MPPQQPSPLFIAPPPAVMRKRITLNTPLLRLANRLVSLLIPDKPLQYVEATGESPSFDHGGLERTAWTMLHGTRHPYAAPGPSTSNLASGNDWMFNVIADSIGGNTPLADWIMNTPCTKFKMPHIEKYKGEGHPTEHAHNFYKLMHMQQVTDPIICRALPVTLTGSAKM